MASHRIEFFEFKSKGDSHEKDQIDKHGCIKHFGDSIFNWMR